MENKLEVIDTKFEKLVSSNDGKITFFTLLALFGILIYALIYNVITLIFTPQGLTTIVIVALLYKLIYAH